MRSIHSRLHLSRYSIISGSADEILQPYRQVTPLQQVQIVVLSCDLSHLCCKITTMHTRLLVYRRSGKRYVMEIGRPQDEAANLLPGRATAMIVRHRSTKAAIESKGTHATHLRTIPSALRKTVK